MHFFHKMDKFKAEYASIMDTNDGKEELEKQYAIYKFNSSLEKNVLFFNYHKNSTWFTDRYGEKYAKDIIEEKKKNIDLFLKELPKVKVNFSEDTKDTAWIESYLLPLKRKSLVCLVPANFNFVDVKFIESIPGIKEISLSYPRNPPSHSPEPFAVGRRSLFVQCIDESHIESVLQALLELELPDGNKMIKLYPEKMDASLCIFDALDVFDTPDRRRIDAITVVKLCDYLDKQIESKGWETVKSHFKLDCKDISKLDDNEVLHLLDIGIAYLRYGHLLDYYSGLSQATSLLHLMNFKKDVSIRGRKSMKMQDDLFIKRSEINKLTNENVEEQEEEEESQLLPSTRQLESLNTKAAYLMTIIDLEHPKELYFGKSMEAELVKKTKDFVDYGEDRFTCKCCIKIFAGEHFTRKHIKNKHPDQFVEVKEEILLFNKYASDIYRLKWRNLDNIRKRKYVDHDRSNVQIATNISFE